MMSHSRTRLAQWSLFIVLTVILSTVNGDADHVQAVGAPLFVALGDDLGGDIFSYTGGSLNNLTEYGYNGIPILSPDGETIAYSSLAATYVQEQFGGDVAAARLRSISG